MTYTLIMPDMAPIVSPTARTTAGRVVVAHPADQLPLPEQDEVAIEQSGGGHRGASGGSGLGVLASPRLARPVAGLILLCATLGWLIWGGPDDLVPRGGCRVPRAWCRVRPRRQRPRPSGGMIRTTLFLESRLYGMATAAVVL